MWQADTSLGPHVAAQRVGAALKLLGGERLFTLVVALPLTLLTIGFETRGVFGCATVAFGLCFGCAAGRLLASTLSFAIFGMGRETSTLLGAIFGVSATFGLLRGAVGTSAGRVGVWQFQYSYRWDVEDSTRRGDAQCDRVTQ